ncbi:MAG: glycosyltransferase family 2 protein [Hyphomonadaceae bacterium]
MMGGGYSVTALSPIYNENATLGPSLLQLQDFLSGTGLRYEVLLIESGSTDGTGELCDRFAAEMQNVRVIHEGARNGFGAALQLGFREARGDLIWVIPIDMPYDLEILREGLKLIHNYDAVVSYRPHDNRIIFRRVQSIIYNFVCRHILGVRVRTVNSAFKLYRRRAVAAMPLVSRGWFVDAEVLKRLVASGASIVEIPVEIVERSLGASTVRALDGLRTLGELIRFVVMFSKEAKKPRVD